MVYVIIVAIAAAGYALYKHFGLSAIETELKLWVADVEKAEATAVGDVKTAYTAVKTKLAAVISKL